MLTILILDDDRLFCEALSTTLEEVGYRVLVAHTLSRARELLKKHSIAVIFIDVQLPDGNGLDLLAGLSLLPEAPEAIVVTAQGDPDGAESAITAGAWDYVQKPAHMGEITLMVERAVQAHERKLQMPDLTSGSGIVAVSRPMRLTLLQMFEAAQSEAPVLISGETGTGKELVARAVHTNSRRAKGPFVVVDCGSISPTLLESELFGNVRGAFTGAAQTRQGLVKLADGGTLFLDEVGELALEQQRVFLRLLQERRFRPIGSNEEMESDFRVVAATNRNLPEMAAYGTFRQDLLFRLQGVPIELPPVRARGEDILLLAQYGLTRTIARYGLLEKDFSPDALEAFASYTWPGNVRELLHTVEAAALAASDVPQILLQHLPIHLRAHAVRSRVEEKEKSLAFGRRKTDLSLYKETLTPPAAPQPGVPGAGPPLYGPPGKLPGMAGFAPGSVRPQPGPGVAGAPPEPGSAAPEPAAPQEPVFSAVPVSWKEFQDTVLHSQKRAYLLHLLEWAAGNVPEAARQAGVSRQRLYTLLREHGISRHWKH